MISSLAAHKRHRRCFSLPVLHAIARWDANGVTTLDVKKGGVMATAAETRIREKLMVELEPTRLDVINESELHAGHRNSPGTGESHFRLLIISPKFAGRSRLERHRMINEALAGEMSRIHALAISAFAPGEPVRG